MEHKNKDACPKCEKVGQESFAPTLVIETFPRERRRNSLGFVFVGINIYRREFFGICIDYELIHDFGVGC